MSGDFGFLQARCRVGHLASGESEGVVESDMSVDSKNGANELPRAGDKAFADAPASGGRTSSAQPEIAAQDVAKAPAVAAQAHSTEALAREAASPAKGVT